MFILGDNPCLSIYKSNSLGSNLGKITPPHFLFQTLAFLGFYAKLLAFS